jgi:hypothetical protein
MIFSWKHEKLARRQGGADTAGAAPHRLDRKAADRVASHPVAAGVARLCLRLPMSAMPPSIFDHIGAEPGQHLRADSAAWSCVTSMTRMPSSA